MNTITNYFILTFICLCTTFALKAQGGTRVGLLISFEDFNPNQVFETFFTDYQTLEDFVRNEILNNQQAVGLRFTSGKPKGVVFSATLNYGLGRNRSGTITIDTSTLEISSKSSLWNLSTGIGFNLISSKIISITPFIGVGMNGGKTELDVDDLDLNQTSNEILTNFDWGGITLDLSLSIHPGRLGISVIPNYTFGLGKNNQNSKGVGVIFNVNYQL